MWDSHHTLVHPDHVTLISNFYETVFNGAMDKLYDHTKYLINKLFQIRLVVEEGLNQLPYQKCVITTPTGIVFFLCYYFPPHTQYATVWLSFH